MNIIVCTKQIRYTYARTGNKPDTFYFNPEDAIYRVNPFDESALELALRVKDKKPDAKVTLLTLGPMIAENELRRCMAAGADDLIHIPFNGSVPDDPLDQPDAWTKSRLIAQAAKALDADMILCGKESMDRGSGQVGGLLAQLLGMPFVSAITDLTVGGSSEEVQVQRSAGRGVREIIACSLPAVLSVDLGAELRMPMFEQRQKADHHVPRKLELEEPEDRAKLICTHRFQPRPRPLIVPPPDSRLHSYDRVLQLLTGSKVEKKGEMLTGSPESQADGILAFLKENGFLETEKHG
jgi:electron transfer flavoprotein beta subunit